MGDKYILDEYGRAVEEPDILLWSHWFQNNDRHVAENWHWFSRVSTVFLGLDHSFHGGPPLLWETMVFGGLNDHYQERYSSLYDAMQGHSRILTAVKTGRKL